MFLRSNRGYGLLNSGDIYEIHKIVLAFCSYIPNFLPHKKESVHHKLSFLPLISIVYTNYGPSVEIRCILIPKGNQNHSVTAVQPLASNCPLDSCI